MKKIFILFVAVLMFTACKNVTPEIKFELNITGEVSNEPSKVHGDFNVNVTNFVVDKALLTEMKDMTKNTLADSEVASDWLTTYVEENVINEFPPQTIYEIAVKGMLHEEVSGMTLIVNKTFSNKPVVE
jgi:hypothetical protein